MDIDPSPTSLSGTAPVLVTGGSGFLAVHLLAQLLARGHGVRTTLRNPERAEEVRTAVQRASGFEVPPEIGFVSADLSSDEGWADAADGVRYVLHVASPFPVAVPTDENEIIRPARDGALRVIRAARTAGVERVVLTSSFAAVGYGHPPTDREFTESDWTDIDGPIAPYIKSKALAERAAWDFMERGGGSMELSVVNPVGIFGPPVTPDLSASTRLAAQMLTGMRGVPRLATTVVDVRDVADLHLRAMTAPEAAGERFLASVGEPLPFRRVAETLRHAVGRKGPGARSFVLPDGMIRFAARRNAGLQGMVTELGKVRRVSSAKARDVLGWEPRSNVEALSATASALRGLGLLRTGVLPTDAPT
ncbi:SDR family oxidoreductase [Myceligenerans indicum]|uniref:Aldehyde reductase n=1 Tax=Myceligenerans indicum TaxID=2593663 RepID=A0ABS1LJ01_9MICO|nr:aldehyde reductase [Myceligenerans indicum]MBL0886220.1 aldehyde reductase [Myceligenerans indicum]